MRVSLLFNGFASLAETLPLVGAAESHGLDGVWYAEHLGFHDAVVPATAALAATRSLAIGLVGPAIVARHPGLLAMELASLAELAPGRVRVQVGLGDGALIARLGGETKRAAARVEEMVLVLRDLLAGKSVSGMQAGYSFEDYRIARFGEALPIDVMAIRPLMLATAARVADGVGLSGGASRSQIGACVRSLENGLAAAGRKRDDFRITAFVLGAVREHVDAAHAAVAKQLGMFSPDSLAMLAPGLVDAAALRRAREAGPDEVERVLTREVVSELALVADPSGLEQAMAAYQAVGIDELTLSLAGKPAENAAFVEEIGRAAASLRNNN